MLQYVVSRKAILLHPREIYLEPCVDFRVDPQQPRTTLDKTLLTLTPMTLVHVSSSSIAAYPHTIKAYWIKPLQPGRFVDGYHTK